MTYSNLCVTLTIVVEVGLSKSDLDVRLVWIELGQLHLIILHQQPSDLYSDVHLN